jgi:thiamine-phosphate pyrophosphorylase
MINEKTNKFKFPDKLYLITDSSVYSHIDVAMNAKRAGCKIIQLRYKGTSTGEFFEIASKIRETWDFYDGFFIVNDRADVALACSADALHLGDEDLPIEFARKICGDSMIIGLSTHCLDQALKAVDSGADYIGLGPVFSTDTKKSKYEPLGLSKFEEIASKVEIPITAIGGIKHENAKSVLDAGADSVAICSAISHADDIGNAVFKLYEEVKTS